MKKIILIVFMILAFSSSVYAEGNFWKDLFVKDTPKKAPPAKPLQTILGAMPLNLNGDTIYLINGKSFGAGVGVDLATWKNIINLRGETTSTAEGSVFAGAGIMVNIPSLLSLIPGVNWNASFINPSVGVVPGYNFATSKGDVGIVLSIIQVTF